jgi:hypothetical protein
MRRSKTLVLFLILSACAPSNAQFPRSGNDYQSTVVPEGCVTPEALKVGVRGYGCWDTHVEQVIDDGKMLARITFNKLFRGTATDESAWVMMKCKTTGITDGKRFGSWELDKVLGTAFVKVTGTTTYRTAGGSTKTVFVVEPMYRGNLMYTGDDLA